MQSSAKQITYQIVMHAAEFVSEIGGPSILVRVNYILCTDNAYLFILFAV